MIRRKKKILRPRKDTFAIVVDGETEVWYFQMLKRNEPNIRVNIEPKIPQKKRLSDLFRKVLELSEDYTRVFWIIDLDAIIKESRKSKKGKKTGIQELKRYLKKLNEKRFENVVTILNNPCLEYWFLLHFEATTKYFPKCFNAEKELKKHLNDYEKTRKYFTKQNNDIYLKLKSRLSFAIANAKRVQRNNFEEAERGICEMNLFFENKSIFKGIL